MAFLARSNFQGHPRLYRFTRHFPGPKSISEATPAYPDLTATSQARASPECHPGLSQLIRHFPGPQSSFHTSPEPSYLCAVCTVLL